MSTCIDSLPPQELLALTRHPAASGVLDTVIEGPTINSIAAFLPCDRSTARGRYRRPHWGPSLRVLLGAGRPIFSSILRILSCAWAQMTDD